MAAGAAVLLGSDVLRVRPAGEQVICLPGTSPRSAAYRHEEQGDLRCPAAMAGRGILGTLMVPVGAFVWTLCNTTVILATATGNLPRTAYLGQRNNLQYPRGLGESDLLN